MIWDKSLYSAGNAYQTCTNGSYGAVDYSQCKLKSGAAFCAPSADGVWKSVYAGTGVSVAACTDISAIYASGNAFRACKHHDTQDFVGVWGDIDATNCVLKTC